jgi:Na+/melibiose symporter-like transporter
MVTGVDGKPESAQGGNGKPKPPATESKIDKIKRDAYLLWHDSPEYQELFPSLLKRRKEKEKEKQEKRESNEPDESGEPDWYVITAYIGFAVVIFCLLVVAVLTPIIASLSKGSDPRTALLAADALFGVIAIGVIIIVGFKYAAARRAYYERVKRAKEQYVDYAVNDLGNEATLEKLLVLNRRQLDDYHLSSTRQQSIAFRNAQIAAVVGLIVLVIGAVLSMRAPSDTGRYVAAGISTLGAALSAYIAHTFFTLSRRASIEMKRYYQEPFKTHDILMIERIAFPKEEENASPKEEENKDLRKTMVQELLKIVDRHPSDSSSSNGSTQTDNSKDQGDKEEE